MSKDRILYKSEQLLKQLLKRIHSIIAVVSFAGLTRGLAMHRKDGSSVT